MSTIEAGAVYQLGATVEMDWQPQGLVVQLRLPAEHVARPGVALPQDRHEPGNPSTR